ncbi:hypothetical protein EVAR_47627_1 [Eumeta japonica]|uniref:Uncharacterized protein n=1 Tax=Eumeta variegata TaxID=151549 RepID=A0A4C1Z8S9_EUMVA|nr:hypothetical protein EVAR_47627_1 [Eumeta japonica]
MRRRSVVLRNDILKKKSVARVKTGPGSIVSEEMSLLTSAAAGRTMVAIVHLDDSMLWKLSSLITGYQSFYYAIGKERNHYTFSSFEDQRGLSFVAGPKEENYLQQHYYEFKVNHRFLTETDYAL